MTRERGWALVGGDIITPLRRIRGGVIAGTGPTIDLVAPQVDPTALRGWEVRDVSGAIVAPGFVDIHVHGGGGADFMDGSLEAFATACACHAQGGPPSSPPLWPARWT